MSARLLGTGLILGLGLVAACSSDGDSGSPMATSGGEAGTAGTTSGGRGGSGGSSTSTGGVVSSGAAGDGGTSQGGSGGEGGDTGGFLSCQPAERERCTHADPSCPDGQFCQFPGDPTPGCPGGGHGCIGGKTCASDGDCTGGVCTESMAACCTDDTTTTYCLAPCTDRSCGGGFECMPSGHCECTDDACPLNQDCLSLNGDPRPLRRPRMR